MSINNRSEPEELYPWSAVQPMFGGISRVTAWRAARKGLLPKPIKTSPGRIAWRASDVRNWQASRTAEAGAA